jgi:hypothetical protein
MVYCKYYRYLLLIGWMGRNKLSFRMERRDLENKPEKMFAYPIRTLPWMRATMANFLAEHDGTEKLKPIPELAQWILQE